MPVDFDFVAEQFQTAFYLDPIHWCSESGCIVFDGQPVFYTVHPECFVLECCNISIEVPRYS